MKIGRVRRRKKYRRGESKKNKYLATLYLWWVFGTSLLDFAVMPINYKINYCLSCKLVIMVSAGFIETDELINELDRPGEFFLFVIVFTFF